MSGIVPLVTRSAAGQDARDTLVPPDPPIVSGPLVSCLMVTRGDRATMALAIESYRAQTWTDRELVIVSANPDHRLGPLLAAIGDPTIRFVAADPAPLGTVRNASVAAARGALLCVWDDDDLSHPRRIELQMAALAHAQAEASFILGWSIWWPRRRRIAVGLPRFWEASMLVRAESIPAYPAIDLREDYALVEELRRGHILTALDWPLGYCYVVHGRNSCAGPHFERIWMNAVGCFEFGDYERALAELRTAGMPVDAYLAALDA